MNRTYCLSALIFMAVGALVFSCLSPSNAYAQCSVGMMGMCMDPQNCHEPGEVCSEQDCPEGCMTGEECFTGMMGNCHEPGGGSGGCHMEEHCEEMLEYCQERMHERCEEFHNLCEEMHHGGHHHGGYHGPHPGGMHPGMVKIQGTPNPFNPVTTLSFSLPGASRVQLRVYDVGSREVASLVSGYYDEGTHEVTFSAVDLPSGVYFARLETLGSVSITKLLLVK